MVKTRSGLGSRYDTDYVKRKQVCVRNLERRWDGKRGQES